MTVSLTSMTQIRIRSGENHGGRRNFCKAVSVALWVLTACAGGQAKPGSPMVAPKHGPKWLNRGSGVFEGSILGVGSVSGIKNTPLARDTAANRGRAEISKILETYSASLMKDYQASTSASDMTASSEGQRVEQAIKTFSANLMNGAETRELWLDGSGNTWYALVELNFDRAKDVAAAQAKMGGGLKDWVAKNGDRVLSDLESDMGGSARAPAAPGPGAGAAVGQPEAAPVAEEPRVEGPLARVGGAKPEWTQGTCDRARFLCGVGDGADRRAADIHARAEIARIFQASIRSVAESFEGAARTVSSKTNEQWEEVQKVSQHSIVSTNKSLTMSEIKERWDDGKGRVWALAVIDRAQASAAIREQLQETDGMVASWVSRAKETDDVVRRFKALRSALGALLKREALNADLRVIQGSGIPSPHKLGELVAMMENAGEQLSLGIALAGSGAERVQACLEDALTEKGFQITSEVDEDAEDAEIGGTYDILIKGKVRAEKRGRIAGSEVVQTNLTLRLVNGKTGKVVRTFRGSAKGSRGSVRSAASTAAFKICQKKIPAIVRDIDRYFGG